MSQLTVPWREPLFNANGLPTPAGVIFLNELLARVGGTSDVETLDKVVELLAAAQAQVDYQSVTPPDTRIAEALRKIEELAGLIPNAPDLTGILRKLEYLEGMFLDLPHPERLPAVEGWIAPTLLNSWVNYGAPYDNAGYYKDPFGIVRLRGVVKSGTTPNAIFTLPAGYRPANNKLMPIVSNALFGAVSIASNGDVLSSIGSNVYFTLDGVTFRAA